MLGLPLARGAEARVRNPDAPLAAVLVNGGTARRVPGTWSATSEWLAERLATAVSGGRLHRGPVPDEELERARLVHRGRS